MSSNGLDTIRGMLRGGDSSVIGRVAPQDEVLLLQVDEEVRNVVGQIDALFRGIFDDYKGADFADLFSGIYVKMAKGYLRSKKRVEGLAITADELDAFWREIQEVIALFNENGIRVDAPLLKSVMTYGGLSYWQEIFKEEFASFVNTPWIVQRAVASHPKDPRTFLRSDAWMSLYR